MCHARSKYIEIDYHFVQKKVAKRNIITKFVPISSQLADIFTKVLSQMPFTTIRVKIDVHDHALLRLKGSNRDGKIEKTNREKTD